MEYKIGLAEEKDANEILNVLLDTYHNMEDNSMFTKRDYLYVNNNIINHKMIKVNTPDKIIACLSLIEPRYKPNNLGIKLGLSASELEKVMQIESVAVSRLHRGQGIQSKMINKALEEIDTDKHNIVLAQVHPDNIASKRSFLKNGFNVEKTVMKDGYNPRNILVRRIT